MAEDAPKIVVRPNGPYIVEGSLPLVRKSPVMSEYGEPMTWKKDEVLDTGEQYVLCRCGQSDRKPFCDGTHAGANFDGTETADPGLTGERDVTYEGTNISVNDDRSLCMHAGFCATRLTNIWKMVPESADTQVRAQLMSMIERCPSGALSYTLNPGGDVLEPDLPREVAVVPDGPLWVSGGIEIQRADGMPLEVRNRVTLCRCGASKNKPLCDGSHKEIDFKD